MSTGNAMDAERIAAAFVPSKADPLHWIGATLRLLEDHCSHFQNLAECDDPLNMLVCQTEFAEKSFAANIEDLCRGVVTIADTACGCIADGGSLPR